MQTKLGRALTFLVLQASLATLVSSTYIPGSHAHQRSIVPKDGGICSGSKVGIETGTVKKGYGPGDDREYTSYEIFNNDCSQYNEIGVAPGQNACMIGTFSCTPEPITFSSVTIITEKLTCTPAPAGQKCGDKTISVCCS